MYLSFSYVSAFVVTVHNLLQPPQTCLVSKGICVRMYAINGL